MTAPVASGERQRRESRLYRYRVTLKDGTTRLFRRCADIEAELGVTRYYVVSLLRGLGREGSRVGARTCRDISRVESVHKDLSGEDVPVTRRSGCTA
jgi:hypothetical protein